MGKVYLIINSSWVTFKAGGAVDTIKLSSEFHAEEIAEENKFQAGQSAVEDKEMKRVDEQAHNIPSMSASSNNTAQPELEEKCRLCLDVITEPVQTSCGHRICRPCLERCARHDTAPIRCIYSHCDLALSLSDLRNHLEYATFDSLLKSSFRKYVLSHPTEFNNCPTADCQQLFRITKDQDNDILCASCQFSICRVCNTHTHEGLSCAENQALDPHDGNSLEDWRREQGAKVTKQYPKCNSTIEKAGGCNHMICIVCAVHICWICGEEIEFDEDYWPIEHKCEDDQIEDPDAWEELEQ